MFFIYNKMGKYYGEDKLEWVKGIEFLYRVWEVFVLLLNYVRFEMRKVL